MPWDVILKATKDDHDNGYVAEGIAGCYSFQARARSSAG